MLDLGERVVGRLLVNTQRPSSWRQLVSVRELFGVRPMVAVEVD